MFCLLSVYGWTQTVNQDQIYNSGDVLVRVGIGPLFPLYVHTFNFSEFSMSTMRPGFSIGLGVDYYITNNFKVGGNIAFGSNRGITLGMSQNRSYMVPITMFLDWEFHALRFDFPVGADFGLLFNKYRELFAVNFIFRPHAGIFFNITKSWSVGIDTLFWVVPQLVWDDMTKSRVGTFVEIFIAGRYRI